MKLIRSGNPTLNDKTFESWPEGLVQDGQAMTLNGTINKSLLLLFLVVAPALYTFNMVMNGPIYASVGTYIIALVIAAFVLAIAITLKKTWAPYLAPVYAVLQGTALGFISGFYNYAFDGIVLQAVGITASMLLGMLLLYRFEVIRATEKFRSIVMAATAGIAIYYVIALGGQLVGFEMPLIHDSGLYGIIFSLVVVVVAALNLILDFDLIDRGIAVGAPRYFEWYTSFSLLVTLIWLYLEILRLLSKLNRD